MRRTRLSAVVLTLGLSSAHGAFAQVGTSAVVRSSSPSRSEPPADTAANSGLTDIVVTAQRRSENLQRVPIAVTALTSAKLEASNIQSTSAIASITPAITINATVGVLLPRIRGIGTSAAGPAVENSVATYVDGIYIPSQAATIFSLNDVERIEVLKGPQGTLFGRNATGGLISVVTRDPGDVLSASARIGYGNYQTLRGDVYLSGPVAEGVGASLAVAGGRQGKGWGTNTFTGTDIYRSHYDVSARGKLLLELGEHTKARIAADISREVSSIPVPAQISGTAPGAYRDAAGNPIIIFSKPRDAFENEDPLHKVLTGGVSLKVDQELGFANLTSTTAYRRLRFDQRFDADTSPVPGILQTYIQHDKQFTQELQLASSAGGPFQWIVGAFYYNIHANYDPFTLARGPIGARSFTFSHAFLTTESIAGYAQASYEFLPDTHLTAGFRYTDEKRTIHGTLMALSVAGTSTTTAYPNGTFKSDTPTWRVSLDHNFNPDVMGYVSWNRGFKSGGFNGQAPTSPAYKPEYLDAYEAGLKSTLFDRRVRLNAAAFYYNYRDVQVNTFIGTIGLIYNGAKAELYGIDADLDVVLTDRLSLTGGIVAMHDRFTNFPVATIARPNGNGTVTLGPGSATGNRLPYASDVNFNLGATYKADVGDGNTLDFSVNNLYSSGFYPQPDNYYHQKAYSVLNASITFRTSDKHWSVKLWGDNLLDKNIVTFNSAANANQFISYQAPRTYGITLGASL